MPREAFEQRMHELLDRRLRPEEDEVLRIEADADEACRELLIGQQRLFEGLAVGDLPEPPADFAERTVAAASGQHRRPSLRHGAVVRLAPVAYWATAACALALLLAAVPLWSWLNAPQDNALSASGNQNQNHGASFEDGQHLPTIASEASRDAAQEGQSPPKALAANPPDRYQEIYQALIELRRQEDLLIARPQWVDEVALGLKPVAASMSEALNMLRRNLPPSSSEQQMPETPDKPQAMRDMPLDAASVS